MSLTPTQKAFAAWSAIAAAAIALLGLLGAVLTPFLVAAVLAYMLAPLVDRLDRAFGGKLPRVLVVLGVECLFLLLLLAVALLIVPILVQEWALLREQLPIWAERMGAALRPVLHGLGLDFRWDASSIKAFVLKYLSANWEDGLAALLASIKVGGSVALALVGNAMLIPVVLFYLLMDWPHFVQRVLQLVPPRWRSAYDGFVQEADEVLGQYLRGQLLVMLILALYFTVGLALFGLDLALPIGVFTGLAMFVPYVGFGLGLVLALVAGLLQFASAKALVMVALVYGLGQLLESLVLTPRWVGERIGLHPVAVIFALLAFGQLLGFVGILLALPASAVVLVALRSERAQYFASHLYRGPS